MSIPCESLIDPTSDLLQTRINSRLNIAGAIPDDGASVWADSRQAPLQAVDGGPALTTTYFGADYRLGSDLLLGAMVQRDDRIVTLPIGVELTATDAYVAGPYAAYRLSSNLVLGARASWGKASNGWTLGERGGGLHHRPSADRGAAERQLGLGRMAADACGRRHPRG